MKHHHQTIDTVRCAVITVSDTRTRDTDASGAIIVELLEAAGHEIVSWDVVPDEPDLVRQRVIERARQCQAVLLDGGTGVSPRDNTYEAVVGLLDKRLDGFGELFRHLSFEDIGADALLSRAVAGVHEGRAVFAMPGSSKAVRLAMTRLVVPVLAHLVSMLG